MYATSCALALALLAGPPGSPIPAITPEDWPAVRAALIGTAVEWEILDEREERFTRFESLAADLDVLRRRRRELADAPALRDARRFPNLSVIDERLAFNRAYRRQLEQWRAFNPTRAADIDTAIRETDELH